ncbi:LAGLIDADG family homing endonuclease [Halopseudomonas yangmingensis]|uniref:GcrA cell cycle regulator n=1 Tax=Halopseudomonas yangmingensis TaxID=1720063 RepID=A0A1I4UU04_9GAMM|nr:LAGLIDADG family homing endonuclease [Halopseudomonas yangmingensis]SFM92233.1 GcrA cell cycle regulator [Halopseudomonas yangmingensis]
MVKVIKRTWTDDDVATLKECYQSGMSLKEIGVKLERSLKSISGKAHLLGLKYDDCHRDFYTSEEDRFICENAQTMTRAEIGKLLGRSEGSISLRGRRLGLTFCNPVKNSRYDKDHDFFRVPTLENSYLAGLLAADGWVKPNSQDKVINQVAISLKSGDASLLENIRVSTGYTGAVRNYMQGRYPQSELRICGVKNWVVDLKKNWNIDPVKTYILQPPNEKLLSPEMVRAFLVGFIEGDGYIAVSGGTLKVSVPTASKAFADWIEKAFADISEGRPSRSLHSKSAVTYIDIYGANARRLCHRLMDVGVHKLMRKWDVAVAEIDRHNPRMLNGVVF